MSYSEHYYNSTDNLKLYYREYGKGIGGIPMLCLSGLTRNSADFHQFAEHYSDRYQIFALDYRGRGKSEHDADFNNYNPQTYLADVFAFLTQRNIEQAIFIGTSLGGLLTMGMAGLAGQFIAAAALNDVGPEISEAGGERIRDYVGKDIRFDSLDQAVDYERSQFAAAYPDWQQADWMNAVKNTFVFDETDKNFRLNYDLRLGDALRAQFDQEETIDLWPFFTQLSGKPVFAIRGALSDVLSQEVFDRMANEIPSLMRLTLENRGHVPQLTEPLFITAMDKFLAQL